MEESREGHWWSWNLDAEGDGRRMMAEDRQDIGGEGQRYEVTLSSDLAIFPPSSFPSSLACLPRSLVV